MWYRSACLGALLVFGLMGCTGSRPAVSNETPLPAGLTPSEQKLWRISAQEAERLQRTGLLYSDPLLEDYVQQLGERLVPEPHTVPADFRFHVIADPEANAFALPDGNIYVHLGLLARLQSEAQLAQVLSHEVHHVIDRHAVTGYDQQRSVSGTTQVLSLAAAIGFGAVGGAVAQFWGGVSQLGLALTANASVNGHGRAAEESSDLYAVQALQAEGYNTCAAVEVFDILLDEYGQPSAAATFFYADHPQLTRRKAYSLERAEALAGKSLACTEVQVDSAYLARMAHVRAAQIELWVRGEQYARAIPAADHAIATDSSNAALHFWLAEALYHGSSDSLTVERAEDEYWAAAALDTTYAAPYRGLGVLAEAEGDTAAAVEAYTFYLHLDPEAKDRRYIRRRIDELSSAPPASGEASSDS